MRELLTMWRYRRMWAVTLATTVLYAFLLLPFKGLAVLPGFASIRPAAALPVVFGLLFGPAGAWGSALGNAVGDYFGGTWNPVSPYGFVGNLLFGLVGYKLWGALGRLSTGDPPSMVSGDQFREYLVVAVVASALVASVVGWGAAVTGTLPLVSLAAVILVTNVVASVLMGPPLLYFLYPRLREAGLLYSQVMPAGRTASLPGRTDRAGLGVAIVVLAWLALGLTGGLLPGVSRQLLVVLGAVALSVVIVALALSSSAVENVAP